MRFYWEVCKTSEAKFWLQRIGAAPAPSGCGPFACTVPVGPEAATLMAEEGGRWLLTNAPDAKFDFVIPVAKCMRAAPEVFGTPDAAVPAAAPSFSGAA